MRLVGNNLMLGGGLQSILKGVSNVLNADSELVSGINGNNKMEYKSYYEKGRRTSQIQCPSFEVHH